MLPPDPDSPGMIFLGSDSLHREIHITTTSFDAEEEVVTKYPESVPILARLHRYAVIFPSVLVQFLL
jgi:hypothetical protein